MTGDDMEALRDWWDGLREVEQFAAYVAEKSNADGLASTRNLGVEEAIARCQQMLAASEAAADREITRLRNLLADEGSSKRFSTKTVSSKDDVRVLGLTLSELRVAVATADQYHPQWRSSQIAPSSQGE